MAKLNNVEIHFKHSNRTYNTMTAFLVMASIKHTLARYDFFIVFKLIVHILLAWLVHN